MAISDGTFVTCSNPDNQPGYIFIDGAWLDCVNYPYPLERWHILQCSTGQIVDEGNQARRCLGGTWTDVTQQLLISDSPVQPTTGFDISTLDPAQVASMTGLGFFFLLPLWAAAFGVKAIIKTVTGGNSHD